MRHRWMPVVILLAVVAPALAAKRVEVVRSAGVDYSAFETFSFRGKKGLHPEHPLAAKTPLWNNLAEVAARTMEANGYRRDDSGSPDLWITFDAIVEDQLTVEGVRADLGAVTWVGSPLDYSSRTARKGTLIIDVLDGLSEDRVWSGWASEVANSVPKLRKLAEKVTRRILREFPAR